jgi:hypothetical protein
VGVAAGVHQDVGGLDVAVVEALGVDGVERSRDLVEHVQRGLGSK